MRLKRQVSPQLQAKSSAPVWCSSLQCHLRAHTQNWLLSVLINLDNWRRDHVWARVGLFPFVLVGNVLTGVFNSFMAPPKRENPTVRKMRAFCQNAEAEGWPTEEEKKAAFKKHNYRVDRLHFAICGPAGSGKSSLINSFRGLKAKQSDAAPVGIVETTTETKRYPDPRPGMPYELFVWYDVPGAGTLDIPSIRYFNEQGLFIFDFIVLVYDTVESPHPTQQ